MDRERTVYRSIVVLSAHSVSVEGTEPSRGEEDAVVARVLNRRSAFQFIGVEIELEDPGGEHQDDEGDDGCYVEQHGVHDIFLSGQVFSTRQV